jgi:proline iminopeptidase
MSHRPGRLVDVGDTELNVVEAGPWDGHPLLILHGGPGLDHHEFGDYLDPLALRGFRLAFVDQRGQGRSGPSDPSTWTLERMARDVSSLAKALELDEYATLGHSYGAFVVLQHAVDWPGAAARTIVSSGLPSVRFLEQVHRNLETFEPVSLREQVQRSWDEEAEVRDQEGFARILRDQLPFHFADPLDPRIADYDRRTEGAVFSPEVIRHFAANAYGGIDVEDILDRVTQPVLVLAGRHDRTCTLEGAEAIADGIPNAELVVFERSAHMTFVEEPERYLDTVDRFLRGGEGGP